MKPRKPILPYKIGTCLDCECENKKLISKRCFEQPNFCYQKFQQAKYADKQSLKEKKEVKPIAKVSEKRKKENLLYEKVRNEYMQKHPKCEFKGCNSQSEDLHHMRSRKYYLCDTSVFMAVCRNHHTWIHENDKESRDLGYLKSSLT